MQDTLLEIAEKIIIPDIEQHIDASLAITGQPLPENEPATIARKVGGVIKRFYTKKGMLRKKVGVAYSLLNQGTISQEQYSKIVGGGLGAKKPLIDTGTLRSSFYSKASGKSGVVISIDNARRKIAGYLQNDGIKTLRHGVKHYRFFGISEDAYRRSIAYANTKIKEQTSGK